MIQKISVNTKSGLIAAFQCALSTEDLSLFPHFIQDTEIILNRKTGITKYFVSGKYTDSPIMIKRAIANIRKISAKQLLE